MCVVSMTGDFFGQRWPREYPWINPSKDTTNPYVLPDLIPQPPTQEEFDKLKREVEILRDLLIKSKEYDKRNGEPDCEIDEKMKFLKKIAKLFDIDLDDVLKKKE